ncbi:hypothetical protein [Kozakia baliensis]|uniref:hypothetical protein n=1 Tax=Kozakia baliensis TaxID=153496 RepID=UPI00087A9B49|nr:hypothetical protein [Kozakia baliensis]AOX21613.1 hypothetical protein A0U90_14000 [Kozakia baliensis]
MLDVRVDALCEAPHRNAGLLSSARPLAAYRRGDGVSIALRARGRSDMALFPFGLCSVFSPALGRSCDGRSEAAEGHSSFSISPTGGWAGTGQARRGTRRDRKGCAASRRPTA